jgi:hypothetical protein
MWAYQNSSIAADGKAVDQWLEDNGRLNTEIYTFCTAITSYTRADFHLLRRLGNLDVDDPRWWNTPEKLLPYMREHDLLFMGCSVPIFLPDWQAYLTNNRKINEQLNEIGRVGNYVFYKVIHVA